MTEEKTKQSIGFILGTKLGMSQIFDEKNEVIPVTLVQAGPCHVIQVKSEKNDGYSACQLGFLPKKKTSKPIQGHLKKHLKDDKKGFKFIREFDLKKDDNPKNGEIVKVDIFKKGDKVRITGISKAKGFQGTVKRHSFSGAPATHGTKHAHRQPGSIGSTDAARVFKGKKMAGRMGSKTITLKKVKVVDIKPEDNLLIIQGAVPGNVGGLLKISLDRR